jgi:hypothetical protein
MTTTNLEERRLPETILKKAIKSGNEYGWRQIDFVETIETARKLRLGIIGGQVQYVFPDGTCELYWLEYDPEPRTENETWTEYCNRTADGTIIKFKELTSKTNLDKQAIETFEFIRDKESKGHNISDNRVFIIYFDDSETDE